jgi:hypothetical protein
MNTKAKAGENNTKSDNKVVDIKTEKNNTALKVSKKETSNTNKTQKGKNNEVDDKKATDRSPSKGVVEKELKNTAGKVANKDKKAVVFTKDDTKTNPAKADLQKMTEKSPSPDKNNVKKTSEKALPKSTSNLKNNGKYTKEDLKQVKKDSPEEIKKRQEDSKKFDDYIDQEGLPLAFQLVFDEIISKQLKPELYFSYTAMRLRQLGKEIEDATKVEQMSYLQEVKENEEQNEAEKI